MDTDNRGVKAWGGGWGQASRGQWWLGGDICNAFSNKDLVKNDI